MRKLVFAINTSLDGYCDHTNFFPDEEIMVYFTNITRDAGAFLYGRKTYQLMIPYWPDVAKTPPGQDDREVDIEYARVFDAVEDIVVFSRTLDAPGEKKTRIVRTDLHDEILKLKQGSGKNIMVGGVNLASQLAELGLIDEYYLLVHPIVVGGGVRLFEGINLQEKLKLKLVESKAFKSGVVALRYLKQ